MNGSRNPFKVGDTVKRTAHFNETWTKFLKDKALKATEWQKPLVVSRIGGDRNEFLFFEGSNQTFFYQNFEITEPVFDKKVISQDYVVSVKFDKGEALIVCKNKKAVAPEVKKFRREFGDSQEITTYQRITFEGGEQALLPM